MRCEGRGTRGGGAAGGFDACGSAAAVKARARARAGARNVLLVCSLPLPLPHSPPLCVFSSRAQTKRMEARLHADEGGAAPGPPRPSDSSHPGGNKLLNRMRDPSTLQCEIISEVLDTRTRNLIAETKVCDYVLSNELISMALSMVSEDSTINMVLKELFTAEGNELYLRPAFYYIHPDEDLSFFEVMVRVRQRQEVCIGVRYGAVQ